MLKIIGVVYVVWLGVQAIRHRGDARLALDAPAAAPAKRGGSLRTGLVVGVTNPKTIVFFVAFLRSSSTSPRATPAPCSPCSGLSSMRCVTGGVMMIGLGATLAVTE